MSKADFGEMLSEAQREELDEFEESYWVMSPNKPSKNDRMKELQNRRWDFMVLEDILYGDLEFNVERLNRKGHHIREGYQGFMTFQFCGEEYQLDFEAERYEGGTLEFEASKTDRKAEFELEKEVNNNEEFVEYLEENFNSKFNY